HRAPSAIGHLEGARCPVVPALLGWCLPNPRYVAPHPPTHVSGPGAEPSHLIRDAEPAGLESEQLLVAVRGRSTGRRRIDRRTDVEVRRARVHDHERSRIFLISPLPVSVELGSAG